MKLLITNKNNFSFKKHLTNLYLKATTAVKSLPLSVRSTKKCPNFRLLPCVGKDHSSKPNQWK